MEDVIARHLESRQYFLGNHFSAVDIMLGGGAHFMMMAKLMADTPVVKAYAVRITERPAFTRAMEKH